MFYDPNSGLLSAGLHPEAAVPACAYGVEPLSVEEVDAHPDSARLWATIGECRETAELAVVRQIGISESAAQDMLDERFDEGRRDGLHDLKKLFNSALYDKVPDDLPGVLPANWKVMRKWFSNVIESTCTELKESN